MSQTILLEKTGRTRVGIEPSFGTQSVALVDIHPRVSSAIDRRRTVVKRADQRPNPFDAQPGVLAQKEWATELELDIRTSEEQLRASVVPGTPANLLLLKALWGGEYAAEGSTCDSGSTTTSVNVQSGDGANFRKGSWVAIEQGGSLHVRKLKNIATDALTPHIALPGGPLSTALVINGNNYYPTASNRQSVTLQHAHINHADLSDYAAQWEHRGATGNVSVMIEPNTSARIKYTLAGADWDDASTAPGLLPAPDVTDDEQPDLFVVNEATCIFQPLATTTFNHTDVKKVEFTFNGGMKHMTDVKGKQGKSGVYREANENFVFGAGTITKYYDPVFEAYFAARTPLSFTVIQQYGAGLTARFLILEIPTLVLSEEPKRVYEDGVLCSQLAFESLRDTTIATRTTDLEGAPARLIVI